MSSNLFRIGGIAAILSAIIYLASLGLQFAGNAGVGTSVYAISTLLFLVVLVVLYLELRSTSGLLAHGRVAPAGAGPGGRVGCG